jgi:hypothetical protein
VNIFLTVGACGLGFALATWVRRHDFWANLGGMGLMLAIAQAVSDRDPWFLLGVPVFALLLLWRWLQAQSAIQQR